MEHFQTVVIGGGPSGYETAIRFNQLGINTACIEKERLGGVCLNWGCIPTKALVKVADLCHEMRNAKEFGLENFESALNYENIYNRKNIVVEKLVSGIEFLFKKRQIPNIKKNVKKIEKIDNIFYITSDDDSVICTADYIVIGTGSIPKELSFLPFDGEIVLSSNHILSLKALPKSLAIVGGGVIGCEFACIFAQLGVKVDIIEFLPNIVPTEDIEISRRLTMSLKKLGISIHTNTGVNAGKRLDNEIELSLSNEKTIIAEKVLVSVGRQPFFDIETKNFVISNEKGFIQIDNECKTNVDKIYAIGDITGKLMLAHTASKQGLLVADIIANKILKTQRKLINIDYDNIPNCIFTNPEIASCGLSEQQAKDRYQNIKIGKFPFAANGKALGMGATLGFVKTIIDAETDLIIGVHIIGPLATELIAQASILINTKIKVSEFANIIYAHPTISECVMESIEDTHKLAIHTI
jgi:dihydrolipoamide dehydrogenase